MSLWQLVAQFLLLSEARAADRLRCRQVYNDLEHFETPYVVKLHRFTALAETQPVFTFEHPNRAAAVENNRAARLCFDRTGRSAAVCHGFAGYFDACL